MVRLLSLHYLQGFRSFPIVIKMYETYCPETLYLHAVWGLHWDTLLVGTWFAKFRVQHFWNRAAIISSPLVKNWKLHGQKDFVAIKTSWRTSESCGPGPIHVVGHQWVSMTLTVVMFKIDFFIDGYPLLRLIWKPWYSMLQWDLCRENQLPSWQFQVVPWMVIWRWDENRLLREFMFWEFFYMCMYMYTYTNE